MQEISEITRGLKVMAKELNIPVLALVPACQRQRKAGRGITGRCFPISGIPVLSSRMRILFFFCIVKIITPTRRGPNEESDKNSGECIVAKNRHGETKTVPLHWQGEFMRFTAQEVVRSEY